MRRPSESTNPEPRRLSEMEPPTNEHTQAGMEAPTIYVVDMMLSLHGVPNIQSGEIGRASCRERVLRLV